MNRLRRRSVVHTTMMQDRQQRLGVAAPTGCHESAVCELPRLWASYGSLGAPRDSGAAQAGGGVFVGDSVG
jgi:hypothetical protein